jgi:hypothetical protein
MPKPSASPSISNNAVVAMAELSPLTDFNAFRAKNTNNTKERLQHELDYITWAINKEFAGDDAALSCLNGIFADARKSAIAHWPSWTVGSSSSAGMKRRVQEHPDLSDSDDDEVESQPIGKGKAKAKAKVAKTSAGSDTKRKGNLNGLTYFMLLKKNRDTINGMGFGGADCMTTLRFCFDKFTPVNKDAWQRLACVVNMHHDEHREETLKTVPADKVNAALNARWEVVLKDEEKLVDYVTRWEQKDVQQRKVPLPPPEIILPHVGPECPATYERADKKSVIDYTVKKKYKTGSKAGEEFTEQQLANERYVRKEARLNKGKEKAEKIAECNALADGEDARAVGGAADVEEQEEPEEAEIQSGETDDETSADDSAK